MSKGLQIAVATLSVFVGLVWWLSTSSSGEGTFQYYRSVADFRDAHAQARPADTSPSVALRVHGFVVDGSIAKDLPAGHVDFSIRDDSGATLPVRYLGIDVPDLFADGAEVVVEGRTGRPRFLADRVLAKCPSKYEAAPGEDAQAEHPSPRT
jgi:cytochrome c-type biogenesis protein CcmE